MAQLPQNIGPYRPLSVLGEGGMGVVYLAEHLEDGRRVALKTLHKPVASMLHSLRQEIRALRQLEHPGVVRVVDDGVDDGMPWLALEWLQGRTLAQALKDHKTMVASGIMIPGHTGILVSMVHDPTLPVANPRTVLFEEPMGAPEISTTWVIEDQDDEALPEPEMTELEAGTMEMLGWMGQVCQALAYLHGEGIVHCDLKPENIFITPEGRVVLVDFGIAVSRGRRIGVAQVAGAGILSGTALYTSPERVQGQDFDARADLYAVGALLFEILVGRPPFVSEHPTQTFMMHLTQPVPTFAEMGVEAPPMLQQLVQKLLIKRPEERLGHAQVVVTALRRMGAPMPPDAELPPCRPYLYRPGFHGRGQLLDRLETRLRDAANAQGAGVMLVGQSGVGKTRLAMELVRSARSRRVEVVLGQCLAGRGHSALHAFHGPLRRVADRCRERGRQYTEELIGPWAGVLAPYMPSLTELPGFEHPEPPDELPPPAARMRLFKAVRRVLEGHRGNQPLLLMLDDVQWADEMSLACLSFLCSRGLLNRSWCVLGMMRNEQVPSMLEEIIARPHIHDEYVSALDETAIGAMIGRMLGLRRVPEPLIARIVRQAQGNPFFVAEILQFAIESGLLTLDRTGHWRLAGARQAAAVMHLPLPDSLQNVIMERLDALDEDTRKVCEAACVLGREVDVATLEQVAMLERGAFDDGLGRLLRHRICEPTSGNRVRLMHDKLREAALTGLSEEERQTLHLRAAQSLERRRQNKLPVELGRLGHHWEHAGQLAKARVVYLQAAKDAVSRYAHDEAEHHYLKTLALLDAEGVRSHNLLFHLQLSIRLDLVRSVWIKAGHFNKAKDALEAFLEDVTPQVSLESRRRALALLGQTRTSMGMLTEALEPLHEAETLGGAGPGERGVILKLIANVEHQQGLFAQALTHYAQALTLQESVGDLVAQADVIHNMGMSTAAQGHRQEAMDLYLRALEIYRDAGDLRGQSFALNNMASLHRRHREFEQAMACHQQSITLHRRVGNILYEAMSLYNMGLVHVYRGHYSAALGLYREALRLRRELGDVRREAMSLKQIACVRLLKGEFSQALETFQEVLDLEVENGERRGEGNTWMFVGEAQVASGHIDMARECFEKALAIAQEIKHHSQEAHVRLELARLDIRKGAFKTADGHIFRAWQTAHKQQNRRLETRCHIARARLKRHQHRFEDAQDSLGRAAALVENSQYIILKAMLAFEQGHLTLAKGQDCTQDLQNGARHTLNVHNTDRLMLDQAHKVLLKSQQAIQSGHSLPNGELSPSSVV